MTARPASGGALVVAPTRRELGRLARRGGRLNRAGRARLGRGRSPAEAGRSAVVGVGSVAGHRTAAMLDAEPSAVLVSLGFAGGLDPDLGPGGLVVASAYRRGDGATVGDTDVSARVSALLVGCGIAATTGVVLTVDEPLLTPAAKHQARAGSGGLIVDMEGFWLAGAARTRSVPHVGLHCVVDEAGFALPAFVAEVAADPHRREWVHALRELRSVGRARDVAVLALRSRTAARVLGESARAVLGAVADGALAAGGAHAEPNGPPAPTAPASEVP